MSAPSRARVSLSIRPRRAALCSGLAAVLLACSASLAQTPTARVTGVVTDPTGAVVVGAQATIVNQETGVSTGAVTNDSGIYTLSFLNPGPYDLTITASGFRQYVRSKLILETGQVLPLNISLEVGSVAETVTVTAQTPLLQSETSSVNQLIENATIANMPLASRRVAGLMRLMGGVTFVNESSWEGIVNFSIAGAGHAADLAARRRQPAGRLALSGIVSVSLRWRPSGVQSRSQQATREFGRSWADSFR